jgi:hypothetical protein
MAPVYELYVKNYKIKNSLFTEMNDDLSLYESNAPTHPQKTVY